MRWEESSSRFGTVKLYSSKTRKWRTIKAPAAATLSANRKASGLGGAELVLTHPDHWYRERFRRASKSVGISYGQKSPGGWTPHDLRHTCLTISRSREYQSTLLKTTPAMRRSSKPRSISSSCHNRLNSQRGFQITWLNFQKRKWIPKHLPHPSSLCVWLRKLSSHSPSYSAR